MTTAILLFLGTKNLRYEKWCPFAHECNRNGLAAHRPVFAIEASHSDSATYQAFLDEADKTISLITSAKLKKNY